jgi:hypothetical protein
MSSSVELGSGFGRFLAAKIEFSYGAVQTVNLLALRLQWFESTPTHGSYRAILQEFKPFNGQLGIPSPASDTNLFPTSSGIKNSISLAASPLLVNDDRCQ